MYEAKSIYGKSEGKSSLEYMTAIKSDNTLLKKSFLASILIHLIMLWIVFPSGAGDEAIEAQEQDIIIKEFTPPQQKKKPPKRKKVMIKRSNVVIPDPTPDEPEVAQEYLWQKEDESPMDEIDWVYDPGGDQGPIRADGVRVKMPECYDKKLPVYPDLARKARIKGVVILQVVIDTNGRITSAKVISSPGKQFGFDDTALEAIKKWRCYPATLGGRKVAVTGVITVNFVLE
jgi:TonB family protein